MLIQKMQLQRGTEPEGKLGSMLLKGQRMVFKEIPNIGKIRRKMYYRIYLAHLCKLGDHSILNILNSDLILPVFVFYKSIVSSF